MIEIPPIKGPVPKMIKETLSYLRTNVIRKRISKPKYTEKSITVYNYPYQALEEAVVNALYHRDYQEREPVEITIEPTHIDILSYAGPDRSISYEAIRAARKLKARRYRNRRLGDFLKELELTEGRATGIPTIQKALKDNGSVAAAIDTDDDRTYFLMTIPCRGGFEGSVAEGTELKTDDVFDRLGQILGQIFDQVKELVYQSPIRNKIRLGQILGQMFVQVWKKGKGTPDIIKLASATIDLICLLESKSFSANLISVTLEYEDVKDLKRKILLPLIDYGIVRMTLPDKPTSAKQAYMLTKDGAELFN